MAVEEINAAGGVLGRPLEVIARDDNAKPGNAVTIAEELSTKKGVDMPAGTFFSHIGVAVTNYSKQRKKLFPATEPMSDDIEGALVRKHRRARFRRRATRQARRSARAPPPPSGCTSARPGTRVRMRRGPR